MEKENLCFCAAVEKGNQTYLEPKAAEIMDGHVGTSKEGENLDWGIHGKKLKDKGRSMYRWPSQRKEKLGSYMDPLKSEKTREYSDPANSLDLINIESSG